MNENYRITLWRAAVITAVVVGATGFVGWLMRARYDASVNPIKQVRPSAWTSLGVGAMLIPVGIALYVGLSYWYNRPGSATAENRVIRTVILSIAGLIMATGGVLVAIGDPLKNDHNRSIFWRGFGSGWIMFATVIIVEYIILNLATRIAVTPEQIATWAERDRLRDELNYAWDERTRFHDRLLANSLPVD